LNQQRNDYVAANQARKSESQGHSVASGEL
jgi:hypothetical protein